MIIILLSILIGFVVATAPGTNGAISNSAIREGLEQDAKHYLNRFGYIAHQKATNEEKEAEPTKLELQKALMRFQKEFLYYQSGVIDIPTQAKLDEYRCANRDMYKGEPLQDLPKSQLWAKKVLTWNITSYPMSLSITQTREAVDEAFERWRAASSFSFEEVGGAKEADIVIVFETLPDTFLNVAGIASKPRSSHIVLDRNRLWGYRDHLPQGISLFHTLLHEIGHTLGLHHNFYRGSIMFPILKPSLVPFGTLDGVPNVDRIALRRLYGLSQVVSDNSVHSNVGSTGKCPKQIDSITAVTDSEWIIFKEGKAIRVNGKKVIDQGRKIQEVFPKGPEFVNASVSSQGLTLLFVERTIYGYEYDGVTFTEARDFPRELHERVLFYPQAAFPMSNGSVVLLSGNVFATYDVMENAPSFLNDKNQYFPNLPADLRSGIPKNSRSDEELWMFDQNTVSDYDMRVKQVTQLQAIDEFLKC